MRVRMYFACYLYVCVCVCVAVYVCMLRVRCNTVCWRRAPRVGQACLHPQSALFANINPAPLEGHAHASKSNQATHLASQARCSRSRCSFPDRTGRLPSRRSQRPRVCLYDSIWNLWEFCAISRRLISKIRFPHSISVAYAICGTRFDLRDSKRRALEN